MDIEKSEIEGITVIKPNGPLAKGDADQFKGVVIGAANRTPGRIILDASSIPFADSRGLEILLDVTEEMQRESSDVLLIAESNDTLREVMELTRISDEFEFFADVESAVRSFE